MTSTPKSIGDESLSGNDIFPESWVDVSVSPGRVTPVAVPAVGIINGSPMSGAYAPGSLASHIGEEYLRLLKEAQRESNYSSARVSLASSRRDSRCESPKSPPNSPNVEVSSGEDELKGIFINKESEGSKDWMLNFWSARCDNLQKRGTQNRNANLSFRGKKCGGKSIFSKEVMYTFFVSNILSLLVGAGIGLWLSKRSIAVTNFPLN